jgi:hypothetical protein
LGENFLHSYDATNLDEPNSYLTEVVTGSYGSGANFQFAIGYKFNENLILDVNVSYLAGKRYETSDIYKYSDGQYSSTDEEIYKTGTNSVLFNPSLIFSAGFGKGAPYARFGLIATSPSITEKTKGYSNSDGEYSYEIKWKYSGGMALGYQAAAGMNWKLSDKLDFFTEVNFVNMTWYAKKGEITEYTENGEDMLPNIQTLYKEVEFVKEYNPQGVYDNPDIPLKKPRSGSPLSSFGAQAGIRFSIFNFKED